MSALEVEQLATFYTFIYREPVGKYVIHVCDSVVCWMDGYESVRDYLSQKLDIQPGETTAGRVVYAFSGLLHRLLRPISGHAD